MLTGSHYWSTLQDNGVGDPPPSFDYTAYLETLVRHNQNLFRGSKRRSGGGQASSRGQRRCLPGRKQRRAPVERGVLDFTGRLGGLFRQPPGAAGEKLIISDTDHLQTERTEEVWVRRAFLRGLNPIFMDSYDGKAIGLGAGRGFNPRLARYLRVRRSSATR